MNKETKEEALIAAKEELQYWAEGFVDECANCCKGLDGTAQKVQFYLELVKQLENYTGFID